MGSNMPHIHAERMVRLIPFRANAQKGATVIEYGLIATLISIVALLVIQQIGFRVLDRFNLILDNVTSAL